MPPKQVEPKTWRLRGKATDGMTVTLGRYETEKEAKADCDKFTREGYYTDVALDPIEQPPPEEDADGAVAHGQHGRPGAPGRPGVPAKPAPAAKSAPAAKAAAPAKSAKRAK